MYLNSTHCMRSTNDKQLFPSGVENLKDKKKSSALSSLNLLTIYVSLKNLVKKKEMKNIFSAKHFFPHQPAREN